ncbi:hypothetical protein EXIGLDRAFT_832902 [Exidia glandulosa HHB12029]|uniref:F-box domain-containing protein n=1 Tax=Exidia glandulosa HHB12029 TaxID=1314781 RepID=A0A165L4H2_EXIGL|nr:hypothetical protein EXIGLDRAFT_832902 [Exidia glandulosa HHB12029]
MSAFRPIRVFDQRMPLGGAETRMPNDVPVTFNAVVSPDLAAALESHIFGTASSLLETRASDVSPQDIASHVINIAACAVARAARASNARAKINTLPPELLSFVFQFLSLSSRIKASLVCSRWREVALDAPQLWTDIIVSKPALVDAMLSRSQAVPISVSFSPPQGCAYGDNALELLLDHCVGAHAARIRVLSLDDIGCDTLKVLGHQLPVLERLRILSMDTNWYAAPHMLLRSPLLKELVVRLSPDLLESFGDIEQMVSTCPQLRRLYIDASSLHVRLTIPTSLMQLLPCLEEVRLVGRASDIDKHLPVLYGCSQVSVDALEHSSYSYGQYALPFPAFGIVPALLSGMGPIEELQFMAGELPSGDYNSERLRFRSGTRTRGLLSFVSDVDFGLIRDQLDAVTYLAFNAVHWGSAIIGHLPCLPSVRTLVWVIPNEILLSSSPVLRWVLPSLECLCVGTPDPTAPAFDSYTQYTPNYNYDQVELEACIGYATSAASRALNNLILVNIGIRDIDDDRAVERALSRFAAHVEVRRDLRWDGLSV